MSLALEQKVLGAVKAEMKSAFEELHTGLTKYVDQQVEEIKANGETEEKTAASLEALTGRFDQAMADFEGKLTDQREQMNLIDVQAQQKAVSPRHWGVGGTPMADALIESDEFERFVKKNRCKGQGVPVAVPALSACRPGKYNYAFFGQEEVKGLLEKEGIEIKSLAGTANLREVFTIQDILEIQRDPSRLQRVRDVIPVVATTKETIQYAEETVFTNDAAPVSEGGTKPESDITYALRRVPTQTMAHWIPVANQLLDDIPALRPFIETRLGDGLMDLEDSQLLYGSGTEPDLLGFFQHGSVQTYAPNVDGEAGDTKIDSVRRAITKVRESNFRADAVMMSPKSLEEIELAKGSDGHYLWVLPSSPSPTTIWRLPIVETTAIQDDDFLVGAFRQASTIYDRMNATLRMADQHADFFITNMTVILIESRVALVIWRPNAFVAGSFEATS